MMRARYFFGHTFRLGSYEWNHAKGKRDYYPYFTWGPLFKCLPVGLGNLYITKDDHRMAWEK